MATDAVLAPQFDNDTSIATTAFVQRALGNFTSALYANASPLNLLIGDVGLYVFLAVSGQVVNLPVVTGAHSGVAFTFQFGNGATPAKINAAAGWALLHPVNGAITTFNLAAAKSLTLVYDGGASWFMSGTGV